MISVVLPSNKVKETLLLHLEYLLQLKCTYKYSKQLLSTHFKTTFVMHTYISKLHAFKWITCTFSTYEIDYFLIYVYWIYITFIIFIYRTNSRMAWLLDCTSAVSIFQILEITLAYPQLLPQLVLTYTSLTVKILYYTLCISHMRIIHLAVVFLFFTGEHPAAMQHGNKNTAPLSLSLHCTLVYSISVFIIKHIRWNLL